MAAAVLVTTSPELADRVRRELDPMIENTTHRDRIRTSLGSQQSAIVLVRDLEQGIAVVDDYAATLDRLRAAGHPVKPRPEHWGAPRAFITSPGGHRVEVMAAPPPAGRRSEP